MKFWDSSAVVPLLLAERASDGLLALLARDPEMTVWWGATVELSSALARREREKALSSEGVKGALDRLRSLARSWSEVNPVEAVRAVASRLVRVHPLRAGDALQIAAAIVASEYQPDSLAIVSLDDRLSEAAEREGFTVDRGPAVT